MIKSTQDPVKKQLRKTRRRHRLGADATCFACGRKNQEVLRKVKRSMFEAHHQFGASHASDDTVIVCVLCHARMSDGQIDDEVPLQYQDTTPERMVAVLLAWASFLTVAGEILKELAARGMVFITGLDSDYPQWRTAPWAV